MAPVFTRYRCNTMSFGELQFLSSLSCCPARCQFPVQRYLPTSFFFLPSGRHPIFCSCRSFTDTIRTTQLHSLSLVLFNSHRRRNPQFFLFPISSSKTFTCRVVVFALMHPSSHKSFFKIPSLQVGCISLSSSPFLVPIIHSKSCRGEVERVRLGLIRFIPDYFQPPSVCR